MSPMQEALQLNMKTWRIEITTQHVVEAETEMEAVQATNDQNCMEVVSHSVIQVEENED